MNNFHNNGEIPIIKRLFDLYKLFYGYLALFPKKDKYTLGAKCEMYILQALEYIIAASSAPKIEKHALLQKANVKFDTLKLFIRMANELHILDNKKYIQLQTIMQEIGKMLGGWQKSLLQ